MHADPGRIVICAVSAAGDVEAMLLTPAHQFPPGVALSPARRRVLAARDGLVIEDDYDGSSGTTGSRWAPCRRSRPTG